ncbi:MAG: hypothetical protein ACREOW_17665 [Thermodesulfobacteriota bacterium]
MKSKRVVLFLLVVVFLTFQNGCEKKKEIPYGELTGIWEMTVSNGYTGGIFLKQKGDNLSGTFREYNTKEIKFVLSGKVTGDKISIKLSSPKSNDHAEITATVSNDKMQGNWVHGDQSGKMEAWKSWIPAAQ